jgi:hypothetical protein
LGYGITSFPTKGGTLEKKSMIFFRNKGIIDYQDQTPESIQLGYGVKIKEQRGLNMTKKT